jgi:hypothetical protein
MRISEGLSAMRRVWLMDMLLAREEAIYKHIEPDEGLHLQPLPGRWNILPKCKVGFHCAKGTGDRRLQAVPSDVSRAHVFSASEDCDTKKATKYRNFMETKLPLGLEIGFEGSLHLASSECARLKTTQVFFV